EHELGVRHPGRVRVPEIHQSGRLTMQADRVHAVAVEIAHERFVTRVAELERVVGPPEPPVPGTEAIDDVEAGLRGAIDRDGVTAVAVEVACDGDVTRVAEIEGDIGHTLGVGVPQIDISVRLAVEPQGVGTVAVPVPAERDVARVAKVERPDRLCRDALTNLEATSSEERR